MPDPIVPDASAGSSPAAAPLVSDPEDSLSTLNESELHEWRMTGALPDKSLSPVTTKEAESSPVPAAEAQPASSDAPEPPVSTPAWDPAALKAETKKRFEDLLAERTRERTRAERAEQRARDLEASQPKPPAVQPAASPAAPAGPTKPDPSTFTYGTADPGYLEALTDYKVALSLATERQTWQTEQQQARAREEAQRVVAAFEAKAAKARQAHPDFDAVALFAPTEIQPGSAADLWILEDEAGAEILYHLQQPAQMAERRRLLALGPREQLKELVRLGDRLTATAPPGPTTHAPPPAPTLTTRATPADPVERALAMDGDEGTRAYMDAATARELARLKKR